MATKENPVADRLRLVMHEQHLASIEALATEISRPRATVAKWINRNSLPKDGAAAIAKRFGYSIDWLLTGRPPVMAVDAGYPPQTASEPLALHDAPASALDFEIAHVLYKLGVSDPERVAEAVGNIRHIFTRRKP